MKTCSRCEEIKHLSDFNLRSDRPARHRSECKKCQYKMQAKRVRIVPKIVSNARSKLHYAVKTGKVKKPDQCSSCNNTIEVGGHHSDYSQPLQVIWLCVPCHNELHRNLAEAI